MKNFIPVDFFSSKKKKVYATAKYCIEKEGSAIEFDPEKVNLSVSTIVNNEIVPDTLKVEAASAFNLTEALKEERKKEYERQGLHFDTFVEMIIENDTVGMDEFRAKRALIKESLPELT